jgi:hypothetical protein
MLRSAQSDTEFTKSIVTGDETWCFQYEPLTKRQSAECSVGEPKEAETKESACAQKSRVKTLLTDFFFRFDFCIFMHVSPYAERKQVYDRMN